MGRGDVSTAGGGDCGDSGSWLRRKAGEGWVATEPGMLISLILDLELLRGQNQSPRDLTSP